MTPGARPRNPTTVLAAVYALAKQADDALVSQFESRLRHACRPVGSRSKAYS